MVEKKNRIMVGRCCRRRPKFNALVDLRQRSGCRVAETRARAHCPEDARAKTPERLVRLRPENLEKRRCFRCMTFLKAWVQRFLVTALVSPQRADDLFQFAIKQRVVFLPADEVSGHAACDLRLFPALIVRTEEKAVQVSTESARALSFLPHCLDRERIGGR